MSKLTEQYGPHCIGNVIRIIDDRTVIVDAGKGRLSVGDSIAIYEYGEPIYDLSGRQICNYEFIKAQLDVVEVNDVYSVCKTQTVSKTVRALSPLLETTITEHKRLNIDKDSAEPLQEYSHRIAKGDPIKLC